MTHKVESISSLARCCFLASTCCTNRRSISSSFSHCSMLVNFLIWEICSSSVSPLRQVLSVVVAAVVLVFAATLEVDFHVELVLFTGNPNVVRPGDVIEVLELLRSL